MNTKQNWVVAIARIVEVSFVLLSLSGMWGGGALWDLCGC